MAFSVLIEERDPARVVRWEDVDSAQKQDVYMKQRLGPEFKQMPAIKISRDAFHGLISGDQALFAEMWVADPDAAQDIFVTFANDKEFSTLMGLSIEHEHVGRAAIRFIEENKRTPIHEEWLKKLREVADKCRALHLRWRQMAAVHKFEYHSINIPEDRVADPEQDAVVYA